MAYETIVRDVESQSIASIRRSGAGDLGERILAMLDEVWPVLRAAKVQTGHNVVIYHGGTADIEVGVQVFSPPPEHEHIAQSQTPAGRAATTTHFGSYARLPGARAEVIRWCAVERLVLSGTSWEIYGDWSPVEDSQQTEVLVLLEPGRGGLQLSG